MMTGVGGIRENKTAGVVLPAVVGSCGCGMAAVCLTWLVSVCPARLRAGVSEAQSHGKCAGVTFQVRSTKHTNGHSWAFTDGIQHPND